MRLETLLPLLDMPDVTFVSLQHDVRDEDARAPATNVGNVLHVGDQFRDFADTAAAIALLDAVISVDTAVAHLAGAMGKPLLLLLPFGADFRWLRERQTARGIRPRGSFGSRAFGDWASVIEALRHDLTQRTCSAARKLSA